MESSELISTDNQVDIYPEAHDEGSQQESPPITRYDSNFRDDDGRSLLSKAVNDVTHKIAKKLRRDNRFNIKYRNNSGQARLSWAAKSGISTLTRTLLDDSCVDVNSRDNTGRTPLSWATENYFVDNIPALLNDSRVDVNSRDNTGRTPLSWATVNCFVDNIQALIDDSRVDVNSRDNTGRTPLSWATQSKADITTRTLLDDSRTDVNSRDNTGRTPLSWAAENYHAENMQALLDDSRVDVNSCDNTGHTPLAWAVQSRRDSAVQTLLKYSDVDVNSYDNTGRTPLSWAIERHYDLAIRVLLNDTRTDIDIRDNTGRTPLSWAIQSHCEITILQVLLQDSRVDVNSCDNTGRTPLSWAIESQDNSAIQMLLDDSRTDINFRDNTGCTPLSWAIQSNCEITILQALLKDSRIDVNSCDNIGRTPLSWAAGVGSCNYLEILLGYSSVDVNFCDNTGWTPLSWASENRHLDAVRRLLESSKVNINFKDKEGRTPLWLAGEKKDMAIIDLLVKYDKMTLSHAIKRKNHSVIEILLGKSKDTKDITTKQWREVYEKDGSDIIRLCDNDGQERPISWVEENHAQEEVAKAVAQTGKRYMFIFPDCKRWQKDQILGLIREPSHNELRVSYEEKNGDVYFSANFWFPAKTKSGESDIFSLPDYNPCAIAWRAAHSTNPNNPWESVNIYSMLPNGWFPRDGIELFSQLIECLKSRWLEVCERVEDHLTEKRREQLRLQGLSSDLILQLAADAQKLSELRDILKNQVKSVKNGVEKIWSYYEDDALQEFQTSVENFRNEIILRINQYDQTLRDLLQFEFAWVSINEAHRSTSLAISMKRLSWITFVFLPAMFAASLFGMNVDILQNNPDWRWYIVVGGSILGATMGVWLIFKRYNLENYIEDLAGPAFQKTPQTKAAVYPSASRVMSGQTWRSAREGNAVGQV